MARIAAGPTAEQRREQILDAAMTVFAQKGYKVATTKEIADLVGVTPPLLYSYFPSKRELLAAVVAERASIGGGASILEAEEARVAPLEQLRRWSVDLFRRMDAAANAPAFRVMAMEGMHDEELGCVFSADMERVKQPLICYLRRLSEQGRVRAIDPEVVAEIFMNTISSIALHHTKGAQRFPQAPVQMIATFVDLMLHGMAVPGAGADAGGADPH
jgi:AcrR family transcriptional regulator